MTNVSNKADIGLVNQHSLPAFSLNDYVTLLDKLIIVQPLAAWPRYTHWSILVPGLFWWT